MNTKQKISLWLGIVVIAAMTIYPPWVCYEILWRGAVYNQVVSIQPGPYSFILKPPPKAKFIDLYRLGVQYFVVAVVTAGLIVILGDKKDHRSLSNGRKKESNNL